MSGLKATAPDMKMTLDNYMDDKRFMDIQVLSTLGLTEDDLDELRAQPEIAMVEGSHQLDAFAKGAERDLVVKIYGLPEEINTLVLKKGRMPIGINECVVDKMLLENLDLSIGESFYVDPGEDHAEDLARDYYTIVGVVASPYYISVERGTASIGSGSVGAFMYIQDENFTVDYYTAAYALLAGAEGKVAFAKDYDDYVDDVTDSLKPFGEARAQNRYDELIGEANEELDKAQADLDDAKEEAAQKIADAEKELADARRKLDNGWRELAEGRQTLKTESDDAWQKIADAETELADGWAELEDARTELEKGEKELADAKKELEDAEKELTDGKAELDDAKAQLDDARKQLDDGYAEAEKGKKELDDAESQLESGEDELSAGWDSYNSGLKQLEAAKQQLEDNRPLYEAAKRYLPEAESRVGDLRQQWNDRDPETDVKSYAGDLLEQSYKAAEDGGLDEDQLGRIRDTIDGVENRIEEEEDIDGLIDEGFDSVDDYIAQAEALIDEFEAGEREIAAGEKKLADAKAQLDRGRRRLDSGWSQYYKGLEEYEAGLKELEEGEQEYQDGLAKYQDGVKEYEDGLAKYQDGLKKYEDGAKELADGRKKYQDGLAEYYDGKAELDRNKEELPEKIADAQRELDKALAELSKGEADYKKGYDDYLKGKEEAGETIADYQEKLYDARREISKITGCEWYILSRSSNPGYLGFGQDADRMANLASVFPVLFFLVAALVCLTTMTRMVDDQRIQIGSLKALGYSRFAISMKYLAYGALPALIGAILGLLAGYILFPSMIFTAWQIMYEVPKLTLRQYTDISAFSVIAAVACTTLATLWACISTLREVPAQLMRPKAPAAGKRVFLEYIKPLWKRLGFFQKLTARNLFRYQKRFWMTVIGIGGCTALIIAGIGLRYSLLATMSRQYDELFLYQAQLSVSKDIIDEDRAAVESYIYGKEGILDVMPCYMNSVTAETDAYRTTAYIQVCEPEDLSRFVDVHVLGTKEKLELQDGGVIINQKLSELLGVKVGDSFTVDSGGRSQLKVQGINEHYLAHFIYLTPRTYREAFGKSFVPNTYQLKLENNGDELCSSIFERFMKMDGASGTSRVADIKDTYLGSMERIDFVVIIVILCAAALAIVVLYNLSNINITERQRELATIKVLGFYDGEVSAYIYRENIILTIIGIILGILGGHVLHVWLVHSVEIDLMMFGRDTDTRCYIYAAILTTVFSVIVNVMAHFRMKKINMVESLKSAE
ncbi:MAG: hypothetical protein IJM08_00125 [Firmicutes bacterium]|nr:hypothetical protein [Bacillota bacterium]